MARLRVGCTKRGNKNHHRLSSSLDEARGQAKEETRPVELPFPSLIIITWLRDRSRERNRLKGVRFLEVDEVIDHRDR